MIGRNKQQIDRISRFITYYTDNYLYEISQFPAETIFCHDIIHYCHIISLLYVEPFYTVHTAKTFDNVFICEQKTHRKYFDNLLL